MCLYVTRHRLAELEILVSNAAIPAHCKNPVSKVKTSWLTHTSFLTATHMLDAGIEYETISAVLGTQTPRPQTDIFVQI